MDDFDYLEEELNKPSVFMDETKLSSEYVPENLLFRTDNLKALARHFKILFTDTHSTKHMIVCGPVGSGKTSLAKKLGTWIQSAKSETTPKIKYIHINCRRNRTKYLISLSIARSLNSHVPTRGYSSDELLEIVVELLDIHQYTLFLVLDELDYLNDNDLQNLLYVLSRTNDDRQAHRHRIALLMISQSKSFGIRLDSSTQSSLSPAVMSLDQYTKFQLLKIIEDRVEKSFYSGAVTAESMELAAEVSAERGDARRAVELMWFAGKYADKEMSSLVYPEHIRMAKADIEPSIIKQNIEGLHKHQLIFLLGLARRLKLTHAAYLTSGEVEEAYQIVCEEQGIEWRKHTQIWEYINQLHALGIISTERSGTGFKGNTQYISIQDVSAHDLELAVMMQLEAYNLNT
ncbi:MAG: AAA family ATPase [Candidatus Heimdallarchaeota archaeon]|nr:AAA family ATPase [Candidatus Heimdallarchaeota archaeon]